MLFKVQWDYQSGLVDQPLAAGSIVDIDPALADHINRDSSGVLIPAGELPVPPPAEAASGKRGKRNRQFTGEGAEASPPVPPEEG